MCLIRILTTMAFFHLGLCMDLPAPVHLNLSSQYFVHLLSWEMGPGSPDGVHYTVSVQALYGGQLEVKECENVTFPLRCNLTEALSNVEDTYYVSVTSALGNRTSPPSDCKPFKPINNTTYEPPLLTVTVCNRSLCISLRAPAEKLHSVYSSISYRLTVSSEDRAKFSRDTEGLNTVSLDDLAPGHRYCVTASIIGVRQTNRPAVCATFPKRSNVSDVIISFILFLLMLPIMICTPRYICRFFHLKRPLPPVLNLIPNTDKAILVIAVEFINKLCEERSSMEKIKTKSEENDTEEESEEVLKPKTLKAHYVDTRGSPLSLSPTSSSSVFLMSQTPETSLASCTDESASLIEGSHIQTEPTASPGLPKAARALEKISSVFSTHVEDEDRESSTDVNLFSVTIGGVSDKTCNTEDVQESCAQHLLQTSASSAWISDSQNSQKSIEINILEEDDDSGYLSRN